MDDPFIVEIENALSPELCNEIIEKFERDEDKLPGISGDNLHSDIKKSTDLFISENPKWVEINDLLLKNFFKTYKNVYNEKMKKLTDSDYWWGNHISVKYGDNGKEIPFVNTGLRDTINTIEGFQIQRTEKGQGYKWHTDYKEKSERYLTYIYYLNTLDEEDDGCTEFINGRRVRPEQGKLLIFPATWTCVHRGRPVLGKTKYIATGWFKYVDPSVDLPEIRL